MHRWKMSRLEWQKKHLQTLEVKVKPGSPAQKRRASSAFPSTPTKYGKVPGIGSPQALAAFRRIGAVTERKIRFSSDEDEENKENSENDARLTPTSGDEESSCKHAQTPPTYVASSMEWSKGEDEELVDAVKMYGEGKWDDIASHVSPNCSPWEAKFRFQQICPRVKGPWNRDEDELLTRQVQLLGTERWAAIATHIPGRSGKQCRERWRNHLDPSLRKDVWTESDDEDLLKIQSKLGNKWAEIAKLLGGRAENAVKNRFNSLKARHRVGRRRVNRRRPSSASPRRRTKNRSARPSERTSISYGSLDFKRYSSANDRLLRATELFIAREKRESCDASAELASALLQLKSPSQGTSPASLLL